MSSSSSPDAEPEALAPCEVQLDPAQDGGELWLRTARERDVDDGELAPDAFVAGSKDAGKLSGARSTKETPEGLLVLRNRVRPLSVQSVWGISVLEAHELQLRLVDDSDCPKDEPGQSPGHTYLDLRKPRTPQERKTLRFLLAVRASDRGQLFPRDGNS